MSRAAVIAGALSAILWLALLQLLAGLEAGVFEYPLDDVYIHLAIAQRIALGTYGINPGEPASAASSVLYPLLLTPFPGTGFQRLLPAIWNALGVGAAGALWGRAAAQLGAWPGLAAAVLGPPLLFISGVGFTGMEHALHLVASLLTLFGLWLWLTEGRLTGWFAVALIVAPLLRFEGLALSLLAAGAVAVTGRARAGILLGAGAVLPVVLFGLFLASQGLSPIPNSVQAKTGALVPGVSGLERIVATFQWNTRHAYGLFLLALPLGMTLLALLSRERAARILLLVAAVAMVAHLALGQVGWMSRYEVQAVVTSLAALMLVAGVGGMGIAARAIPGMLLILGLGFGLRATIVETFGIYVHNPRAIHLQQAQMARFSHGFLPQPVAVNDLGRVAWNAPAYVLDLWGLASAEALHLRFASAGVPGWAGPLVAGAGVRYAMIYDTWLGEAAAPGWIRMGELRYSGPGVFLGGREVAFYATDPALAPRMREALEAWATDLPEGASFVFDAEPGR